ncbi:carboxypeptidase regulatory-like domain-containing protein [Chitinophaga varians]|nr:carboxypeptidase regulatory-like domain-containing protein [Chitinophaga varians]
MDSLFRNNSLRMDSVKGMDSLRTVEGGSISGKVTPADGAAEVEADNGSEKLKGAVSQGAFAIPAAKAGTYTITIVGKAPYKSAIIKDVKVEDGKATDLGEIKLEQ